MTLSNVEDSTGLLCPSCGGVVDVPEGLRVVSCRHCESRLFVQGEKGIRRWQVAAAAEPERVRQRMDAFFRGIDRAPDLRRRAEIRDIFLVFLPYWRVRAIVAGWIFGRVKKDKDSTKPIEVQVFEEMHWTDAATDVSEFGVHQVSVSHRNLVPFDNQQLHAAGMVFEPTESRDDALSEADAFFAHEGKYKRVLKQILFDKFHFLRRQQSLIYYPLWIVRYSYKERSYQAVADGVSGEILYGKAPGNIWYRALMLTGAMALGNFLLVNGTMFALRIAALAEDLDEAAALVVLPAALGLGAIVAGYRAFRFGEMVEMRASGTRKALEKRSKNGTLKQGMKVLDDLSEGDLSALFK